MKHQHQEYIPNSQIPPHTHTEYFLQTSPFAILIKDVNDFDVQYKCQSISLINWNSV